MESPKGPALGQSDGEQAAELVTMSDEEWASYLMDLVHNERPNVEDLPPQPVEVSTDVFLGGLTEAEAVAGVLVVDQENSSRYRLARADLLLRRAPSLGIDCVLCMAPVECGECERRFHSDRFRVLDIRSQDTESYDIFAEDVPRALDFIQSCLKVGGRMLVHCAAGRNRSVTVCAAWMMYEERMMLVDVVRLLARRRGLVLDNNAFLVGLVRIARAEGLLMNVASLSDHDALEQDEFARAEASRDEARVIPPDAANTTWQPAACPGESARIDAWDD